MRLRASACALTVLAGLVVSAAPSVAAPTAAAEPPGRQVTLITGDVVTGDLAITPARREHPVPFARMNRGGDEYVIPGDVQSLVASGQLDQELFNVTGLLRQRYDDAHTDTTPLLVERPAGLRAERTLDMLDLTAVRAPKKGLSWRELTANGGKVWLNAKLYESLDVSVPLIGAPAAWQAGFTGEGVTVAVLDTGVDADHPDLAGRIAVTRNFSDSPDTDDRDGHGTHVASTIASGDATYRGVAPGAKLAIGKVLGDEGEGQLDDIIAGMRWAAAEQRADVVNMSLGSRNESDGTDPVSQALNELSATYGTLFVVAAGNSGTYTRMGMAAAADAALTVASTTKTGAVSDFSTRGPRLRDAAMKPEIAAPGSDIVAAQAGGTHVSMSGTSMASPHIAGAAAILAGQHPDWTGARIKAALVSTAAPADAGVYEVGSGRADLANAVSSTVLVSPATVSANLKWPNTKPRKDVVTYENTGAGAVTLSLRLDLPGAPAGLARLSTNALTIAPGARASVTVTTTPRSGRPGQYGGVLTATAADGRTTRTPVSVQDEAESYDLGLTVLDRAGKPLTDYELVLVNQETTEWKWLEPGVTHRLPRATYSLWVTFTGAGGEQVMLAHPVVDLKRDSTVRLDGRQARRVSVTVDRPEVRAGIGEARVSVQKPGATDRFGMIWGLDPRFDEVYVHSTPGVTSPVFHYAESYRLEEAVMEMFTGTAPRVEIPVTWWDTQPAPGTRREHVVDGGSGTPEELSGVDTEGNMVVIGVGKGDDVDQRIADVAASGAASVVVTTQSSDDRRARSGLPALYVPADDVDRLLAVAKAGGEVTWTSREGGKERYELVFPTDGKIPTQVAHNVRTADLAAVRTRYHGQTADAPPIIGARYVTDHASIGLGWHVPIRPSQERVEYFTPGTWNLSVSTAFDSRAQRVTLAAGSETQLSWNRAVLSPGFTGGTSSALFGDHPWAFRRQDMMDVTVPFFTDADGHTTAPDLEVTSSGFTTLYQDGRLLGTQNLAGRGTFWVGQRGYDYRLVTEVVRDEPWWPLSTRIGAEWTFTSEFTQGPFNIPLPLLSARAEPPVDITNRAPAGPVTIPVTVSRQDGPATVSAVAVEFSTDDGATWRQATVSGAGDRWLAQVDNPADGFVSLRTKASDTDGNTLDQTVIRAYQVG